MRILVLLASIAAIVLAVAGAQAAGYRPCAGGFAPDGSKGDFYSQIKAKGVGCATARTVVRAWIRHQNKTDGANPTGRVTIRGYRCSGKAVHAKGDPNGGLAGTCVRGRAGVRFYGHP